MNNLSAERVLFAFAKAAGEDYLFRLINPGMAVSRRRFAGIEPAIETTAPHSDVNRKADDRRYSCVSTGMPHAGRLAAGGIAA
jgi:hypothetical protein